MQQLLIQYKQILSDYIANRQEQNLYVGQNYVRQLMKKNVAPEDVINIHKKAIEEIYDDLPEKLSYAYEFLIEVMVQFGLKFREHQSLLIKQEELRIEMDIATRIQNHLLKTTVPQIESLDIGMLSIPLRQMNGDCVYCFLYDKKDYLSFAVTDVVGKGVPAALCMSMVKNGLETLEYANNNPSHVLEVLNRIIEKSVDDSMFVSSFYGRYDLANDVLTYGSAGHEPGLYFRASDESFHDLESKGLLLGVLPEVKYPQFDIQLKENDFVVIMTDGVTEIRDIEVNESRNIIKEITYLHRHLSAQEICEKVYSELQKLQDYAMKDDFTIFILKK
ncbi:PP2C family protein-serine/threonine phosphatase [Ureibacillus massiliensis]|uniref:PP2C family protein-serine/threonine phosphatase n=1 Tax=Ureibacillus massiliensis TaxID=292806 RepID=UPI0005695644|nr:PP2C family protein-serine/threonine phosphatase [Ureibacillus massiliensis]